MAGEIKRLMELPVNKIDDIICCERCSARCKIVGQKNPNAKMLRRSNVKFQR